MRVELVICENVFDYESAEVIQTDDVCDALYKRWGQLPEGTRLFHGDVADINDVTPQCEADIDRLQALTGKIYAIVYPKFFLFGLTGILGSLLKVLLLGLITYLLTPKPPKPRNTQADSPNNGLSERTNEARPGARIPDIFGRVRSTPDLLAPSYFTFETHREVEWSYLCIGRGYYFVEEKDVKDDDTPVTDISGLSVEIYEPFTSPNSGDAPQLRIGSPVRERIWTAVKQNGVNGQILLPPNAREVEGDENIAFNWPDQIVTNGENQEIDFEEFFKVDDVITVTNATFTGDVGGTPTEVNLAGTYRILALEKTTIVLVNPAGVNDQWDVFGTFDIQSSPYMSVNLSSSSTKWIGPFTVDEPYAVYNNFVAVNGLYKDDGTEDGQEAVDVEIEVQFLPVDDDGNAIGDMEDGEIIIKGSAQLQNLRAGTLKYTVVPTAEDALGKKWQVRARRLTPTDLDFDGRVVDEVQWRECYAMKYVNETHFGNVTTIHSKTYATNAALSIKERKLNMWAARKIPARVENPDGTFSMTEFTTELYPSTSMGLIIRAIALDPNLGNMSEEQLSYVNIFNTEGRIIQYFGTPKAIQFNYTFDDKEMSLEDMIGTVAEASFCTAYRQGNQLRLFFERKTQLSSLLFNHRNKLPGTEQRSISFGTFEDSDGVDLEWVDPDDGAILNFLIPEDGSAVNAKKVEVFGIQNEVQAHFHAWRVYQKILYQNIAVEFNSTQEAMLLIRNERILVSDNTRPETWDGQVMEQDVLTLRLSQKTPLDVLEEYTIFLQLYDGSVQALEVVSGASDYEVVLNVAPRLPLITDLDNFAQTTYTIVKNDSPRELAFLVSEKEPGEDSFTWKINAVNYDNRYYEHDTDYIDGVFDENDSRIIFDADFEEYDIPLGENILQVNPSGFQSNGKPVDIKNNQTGVGPAGSGDNCIELEDGQNIYVDLPTDPTKTYQLLCMYSPRPGLSASENEIGVFWNGLPVITLTDDGTDLETTDWRNIFMPLFVPTGATTRLQFTCTYDTSLEEGGLLDNIRVREID